MTMVAKSRIISVDPPRKPPLEGRLIDPHLTYAQLSEHIGGEPLRKPTWRWLCVLGFTLSLVAVLLTSIAWLFYRGVGIWGIQIPVAWGFAITNFVWWIGIGHAGTLISAILYLAKQEWRNSINRIAEAMTLFAVMMAGLFPLLHLGRPVRFYWILPYPNAMQLWPQWRSPLVWDACAVTTYFTVSLLFWYAGLIPDLATVRDLAKKRWARRLAGVFALGWRGSARHWKDHQMAYLVLAGLLTPLVLSVHSIVSLDFAVAVVPGWHETIFPPYFVAGALYSGFGMILTLVIPIRKIFHLQNVITDRHLDALAKWTMATGLIVAYSYIMEFYMAYYSGDIFERAHWIYLFGGVYVPAGIIMLFCNCIVPLFLIPQKVRRSAWMLFIISILVNIGMWDERYVIIVTSLYRDFMPSAWGVYHGTMWDWLTLAGTVGCFFFLIVMLVKFVPMSSISELRELLHKEQRDNPPGDAPTSRDRDMRRYEQRAAPEAVPAGTLAEEELYGLSAEYEQPEQLVEATRRAREAGYRHFDGYSPFPVHEMFELLGHHGWQGRGMVAPLALIGGLLGAGLAYYMCWYSAVKNFPFTVAGRPTHSWPSFIPITFELGVLGAALFTFFGLLLLCRLPMPYHAVMNAPNFDRASRDRFFLCIERDDPMFDRRQTASFLESTKPVQVSEVKR